MKNLVTFFSLMLLVLLSGCTHWSCWPFKRKCVEPCEPICEESYELEHAEVVEFTEKTESLIKQAKERVISKELGPVSSTFSELKLADIVKDQESIYKKLSGAKTSVISVQDERVLADIANRYERFLEKNPRDLYAHILYGKFLRKVDHVNGALEVFEVADKIDGEVPLVKQQLANCYAELGEYNEALPYFIEAIDLEPDVAQYHYQLGEFLNTYKYDFVEDGAFDVKDIEEQMLIAFRRSTELDPDQWGYKMRYAETYYGLEEPRWEEALRVWKSIENQTDDIFAKEMTYLHQAKVLINMERSTDAKKLVLKVTSPRLEKNRTELLKNLESSGAVLQ